MVSETRTLSQYLRISKKLAAASWVDIDELVDKEMRACACQKLENHQGEYHFVSFDITGPVDHVVYDEEGNVAFVMDEYISNTKVRFDD